MNTESKNLSVVPDIDKDRCIRIMQRLRRKGLDTSVIWCVDRKYRRKITHSLIMPYSYVKHLSPKMQALVVRYVGTVAKTRKL